MAEAQTSWQTSEQSIIQAAHLKSNSESLNFSQRYSFSSQAALSVKILFISE